MMFAEVSEGVWLALIGIAAMVVKDLLDQKRAARASEKLEVVHKATNSVVAKLLETADSAGAARGVAEEKQRFIDGQRGQLG
jgi:hypothetical protein